MRNAQAHLNRMLSERDLGRNLDSSKQTLNQYLDRWLEVSAKPRPQIYLSRFDPTVGHEIQKTRPAVIIQNDVSNRHSPITVVAAISSQISEPPFPREVVIEPEENGLPKRSAVITNQIRSVDRERLVTCTGQLSASTLRRVDEALKISLGLTPF